MATKAPFKLYEGMKMKDKHISITQSMMLNENYLKLSSSAKILYNYMKLWACGEQEFTYSKSLSAKFMSGSTFSKSIKELIEKGFIQRTYFSNGGGKRPNGYKFSSEWSEKYLKKKK